MKIIYYGTIVRQFGKQNSYAQNGIDYHPFHNCLGMSWEYR